jgi:hypothetical protein
MGTVAITVDTVSRRARTRGDTFKSQCVGERDHRRVRIS